MRGSAIAPAAPPPMTKTVSSRLRTSALVVQAVDIVLQRLQAMQPSPDVQALRLTALRSLREAQGWEREWPGLHEQEQLMKRVLDLYARVSKLELGGRATGLAS